MTTPAEPLLTADEVARTFRVDPKTVRGWVKAGLITAIRTPGGHVHYRRPDGRYRCGVGKRWSSQFISSSASVDVVTCGSCRRLLGVSDA